MPPSTGILKYFDLSLYEDGFVLIMPRMKNPTNVEPFIPMKKLYITLKESDQWAKMMEVENVGALNDLISQGKFNDLILVEALMERR